MSITSAKTGSTGLSLALDNNFMEPIATTVVGSGGVNTITFNDIPQGYKHLQLRNIARGSGGGTGVDGYTYRFNADSTIANGVWHRMWGNGGSVSSQAITTTLLQVSGGVVDGAAGASIFGAGVMDILDYSNGNKYKTTRALAGGDLNTTTGNTGQIWFVSGLWMNTAPITSITISYSSNLAQYSRFSLYGIKG